MTHPPAADVRHLFVYGTLQPGDVRWHMLKPFVVDGGTADAADGSLFDTGNGYPAATFGTGHTVQGRTYELRAATITEALDVLDKEEGTVSGLYHRVHINTANGHDAWAYQGGSGLTLSPIDSGDWFAHLGKR